MAVDVFDPGVAPPAPPSPEPPTERAGRGRVLLWTTVVVVGAAAVGAGIVVGYGTATYGDSYDGRILPTSVVAGVELDGLTEQEALAAVEAAIEPEMERTIRIRGDGRTWSVTPAELGSTSDAEEAVGEAVATSADPGWLDYARMRWLGQELSFDRDVTVTHSVEGARAYVDDLAEELNLAPVDASLDYSTGWVTIVEGTDGRVVDTEATADALFEAVTAGEDSIDLVVHATAPAVPTSAYDQVLLLRQLEHKLYLYEDGEITHTWNVAVGTGDHPTPLGQYEVTLKRYMPTWINPSPNGWGANMPARIGPGVNNPLGVRALNWNAPAIRFHGTANVSSIGTDASKGCVRLTNSDVVQLYDLVDEGAAIVSVRA